MQQKTIKQEMMQVLERIAATLPSRKVTVMLCCEGDYVQPAYYHTKNRNADITVLSFTAPKETINIVLNNTYDETKTPKH